MIELYEFNLLTIDARANYLWENGVYLIAREEGKFKINLYKLNTFYVEVHYSSHDNSIQEIKSFKSIEALTPYLSLIHLEDL